MLSHPIRNQSVAVIISIVIINVWKQSVAIIISVVVITVAIIIYVAVIAVAIICVVITTWSLSISMCSLLCRFPFPQLTWTVTWDSSQKSSAVS